MACSPDDYSHQQLKNIYKRLKRRRSQAQASGDAAQASDDVTQAASYSGSETDDGLQGIYESLCRGERKRVDRVIMFVTRFYRVKQPFNFTGNEFSSSSYHTVFLFIHVFFLLHRKPFVGTGRQNSRG